MAKRAKTRRTSPPPVAPETPAPSLALHWKILQAAVICLAVFWIYWPALHGAWLWDDKELIAQNALVKDPAGLSKIWFQPSTLIDYLPITVSVEWMAWHLWGANTLGYHVLNVVLHVCSSLLVWHLFRKLGLRLAWVGGLIFAIHPVLVESVAWMAELKNTLSLPPFLLAMCWWIDYDQRRLSRDYALALGAFVIALLCKTTMVMFPVVILLYAWWSRGRVVWNDLRFSLPFFIVSLVLGMVTVWFQQVHAIANEAINEGPLLSRVACAGLCLIFYLSKTILPVGLLPIYPQWKIDPPQVWQFSPWLFWAVTIGWLWHKRDGWGRHGLFGMGFFLVNLIPFAGFVSGSYMNFTWAADHFLYIPIIGLIGFLVAVLADVESRVPRAGRYPFAGAVTALALLLAFGSRDYARDFVDSETLWTYTLQHNQGAWPAHSNLANIYFKKGLYQEALDHDAKALQLQPNEAQIYLNTGNAYLHIGKVAEAATYYEQALRLNPQSADGHYDLALTLAQKNNISQAREQYEEALAIDPNYAEAHNNLGVLLEQSNEPSAAMEQFTDALRIDPNNVDAHTNMGKALMLLGRPSEASDQFKAVIDIQAGKGSDSPH